MTAAQAAGAGNTVGFQAWQRRGERLDAGQMRAIGADPADDLDAAVEQECNVAALHRGSHRLGAVDEGRSSASARRSRTAAIRRW